MPRKKRPLDRDRVFRDASLVVIASEDTHAVEQYFALFKTRRIQYLVLPTEEGRSSPEAVLARLDAFKRDVATESEDEFCVCIDTDHWVNSNHVANLTQVLTQCRQKKYSTVISKPCFELWLLLHFEDYSPSGDPTCDDIEQQLREVAGGYQKNNLRSLGITAAQVRHATERAKALDAGSGELIPSRASTQVYKLIEALQKRDAIEIW